MSGSEAHSVSRPSIRGQCDESRSRVLTTSCLAQILALWLNVWTASIQQNPTGTNTGYYVGIYILFGLLNVLFLGLQFWYVLRCALIP